MVESSPEVTFPSGFSYKWSREDWQGALFGGLSGLGYAGTFFLDDCQDAGFELGASTFIIYEWWTNSGFIKEEKYIAPIPDYFQILLSMYYMYACVLDVN
jgi:hypothetical protein